MNTYKHLFLVLISLLSIISIGSLIYEWQIRELTDLAKIVHLIGNIAMAFLAYSLIFFAWKKQKITSIIPDTKQEKTNTTHFILLVLSVIILYVFISGVIYTSWLKGDDFGFGPFYGYGHGHKLRLLETYNRYMEWVSRTGDIISMLGRLSENRWQVWIITPLFLACFPFAVASLFGIKRKNIVSKEGLVFFWFATSLLVVSGGMYTGYWRIFWGYAAANTYFWPCVCTIFLLSCIRRSLSSPICSKSFKSKAECAVIYLLACYCGASLECLTPFIFIGASVWIIKNYLRAKEWSVKAIIALIGYAHGAYILFSSPALNLRSLRLANTRTCDVSSMSFVQMHDMLSNLTSNVIKSLQGFNGNEAIVLKDIYLPLRVYFIPHITKSFFYYSLPCWIIICILFIFMVSRILKNEVEKKHIHISIGILTFSFLCVFSYLGGGISHPISFFPAVVIASVGACYMFWKTLDKSILFHVILTVVVAFYALLNILPAYVESKSLKHIDITMIKETKALVKSGCNNIIINRNLPFTPKDKLGLISLDAGLKEDPSAVHNVWASISYRIDTITIKQNKRDNKTDK